MLAEKEPRIWAEKIDEYRDRFDAWVSRIDELRPELEQWDWREDFWAVCRQENPRISMRAEKFVKDWIELVLKGVPVTVADNQQARKLIADREWQLKGSRARLSNRHAYEHWEGETALFRLSFRWTQVRRITADILGPLAEEEAMEASHEPA
jgi:hypothetical protein